MKLSYTTIVVDLQSAFHWKQETEPSKGRWQSERFSKFSWTFPELLLKVKHGRVLDTHAHS